MCGAREAATRAFGGWLLSRDYTEPKHGFFFFVYGCHLNNRSSACLVVAIHYSQAVIIRERYVTASESSCNTQAACLGASWRSDWPQETEERVPGQTPEAVGMSWCLVYLARIFLTPRGAIVTEYTINLGAVPGEKYTFLKASSVRKVSSAEGFFWFSSAEKH